MLKKSFLFLDGALIAQWDAQQCAFVARSRPPHWLVWMMIHLFPGPLPFACHFCCCCCCCSFVLIQWGVKRFGGSQTSLFPWSSYDASSSRWCFFQIFPKRPSNLWELGKWLSLPCPFHEISFSHPRHLLHVLPCIIEDQTEWTIFTDLSLSCKKPIHNMKAM